MILNGAMNGYIDQVDGYVPFQGIDKKSLSCLSKVWFQFDQITCH